MYAKSKIALFIALLLTLLAGSTAQAAPPTQGGSYDPQVATRFVGEWQFLSGNATGNLSTSRKGLHLFIEDRRTYAEIRICTPAGRPCYWFYQASTLGDKLYVYSRVDPYVAPPWWTELVIEYSILGNGHLQEKYDKTLSWEPGFHDVFEYVRVGGFPPIAPTRAPAQPPVAPVQPVVPGVGQAGGYCGPDTAIEPSLIDRLIGVSAADFPPGECTDFVAKKRPDAKKWLGERPRNAYVWDDRARANGGKYGIVVRDRPHIGDIAVWEQWCAGARENGHVAYVTRVNSDGTFQVEEANWNRTNPNVTVESCISFISPEQPISPIEQFWNWLKSLFGR